jgi:hypothetical protein
MRPIERTFRISIRDRSAALDGWYERWLGPFLARLPRWRLPSNASAREAGIRRPARAAVLVAFTMLLACAEMPLEPTVPRLTSPPLAAGDASELFVAVRPSSLRDDLEIAWVVSVDGQARALLPNRPAFTRLLVPLSACALAPSAWPWHFRSRYR